MREIRFRGKKKSTGEWVYGYYYRQDEQAWICNDDGLWEVEQETVGQYIELKDKNEKEIYESDIIEFKSWGRIWKGEVKYYYGGFSPFYSRDCKIDFGDVDNKTCIVLGNIYKNPELLKGEIK